MAKQQNSGGAVKTVEALARPVVEGMGLRLWDVRFEKEGPDWFLRILIDRDEPLDTDTCEAVSRAIDPLLDEAGRRDIEGILQGLDADGNATLVNGEESYTFPVKMAGYVKLCDDENLFD